jgi:hypothetical protein
MRAEGAAAAVGLVLAAGVAGAYPLDGYEETGIARLQAYWLARQVLLERGALVPGSLWTMDRVGLRLADAPGFTVPPPDPAFTAQIRATLGSDVNAYGIAVLDLTDAAHPRYAELNPNLTQNPASVGKIMVLLAWFQALADLHPDDPAARNQLLKDTVITANGFIRTDTHDVPVYKPGDPMVVMRPIQEGDAANLWTFMDWMISDSSSAAAAMLQEQLVLLKHFGAAYPVSPEKATSFFAETPKGELQRIFLDAMQKPLTRNGLNPERLRQGSFFTREGKNRVPGTSSVATAREMMRYLVLMEQGRLVDRWSSLQIKRLLYLTDTRIRYAASPALDQEAVYFKSGSLYGCKPEPGFTCDKYEGNRMNFMNSIAVVESGPEQGSLRYIAVVLSNVLKKNSVDVHQELAARIQQEIAAAHAPASAPEPPGAAPEP